MPTAELPRSPWTKPSSQLTYSRYAGRSKCIWWFSWADVAGVALRPRPTPAASPGKSTVPAKITIEAASTATTAPAMRRPRNLSTGECSRTPTPGSTAVVVMPAVAPPLLLQPPVHERHVAERSRAARLHALDLVLEAVHPVGVRPVEIATLVVLDLLH